jgi:hypothetical protein
MSQAAIERYTLLIDHNRHWLAGLACASGSGGDAALRGRLLAHMDMSLKWLERHRDYRSGPRENTAADHRRVG